MIIRHKMMHELAHCFSFKHQSIVQASSLLRLSPATVVKRHLKFYSIAYINGTVNGEL